MKRCTIIIMWVLLSGIYSWSGCKSSPRGEAPPPLAEKVTVIDYRELDGCTFLLERENKQKLQPVNLEERYRVNGLRLYVTYKNKDGMSICMAGTMVELTYTGVIK